MTIYARKGSMDLSEKLVCTLCGHGSSRKESLERHIRTHSGEAPYKCIVSGCVRSFKQPSARVGHYRSHTCKTCNSHFAYKSIMDRHKCTLPLSNEVMSISYLLNK